MERLIASLALGLLMMAGGAWVWLRRSTLFVAVVRGERQLVGKRVGRAFARRQSPRGVGVVGVWMIILGLAMIMIGIASAI